MTDIDFRDARRLCLSSQGLHRKAHFGRGKHAVLRVIEQLGYVQIDTISIVDRAHHHVLRTRVPNYSEIMLDKLQWQDRRVFEYWTHAAAYLPMEEYRYYRPMMTGWARRKPPDRKHAKAVLSRIRAEGPLGSRNFEDSRNRASAGWWDWKPAKRVLEGLFLSGELMVVRREGFQKIYDLTENVLPPDVDTRLPSREEWTRFIARRMIRALGIATADDVGYARTTISRFTGISVQNDIRTALNTLAEDGELKAIRLGGETWYTTLECLARLPVRLGKREVLILSPFDNLVINRKRTKRLFGYDYQLECYVPEAKRRFGYFCLPMLWGDEFIGRLDAKVVRTTGQFEIRCLYLENGAKPADDLIEALARGLVAFAATHDCESIRTLGTEPRALRAPLIRAIENTSP